MTYHSTETSYFGSHDMAWLSLKRSSRRHYLSSL